MDGGTNGNDQKNGPAEEAVEHCSNGRPILIFTDTGVGDHIPDDGRECDRKYGKGLFDHARILQDRSGKLKIDYADYRISGNDV